MDARVGRTCRTFGLGCKLHLWIDARGMLPLTSLFASANQNEKKHLLTIVEKTKRVLSQYGARLRRVIADSKCSDRKIRRAAHETVIPYPANRDAALKTSSE